MSFEILNFNLRDILRQMRVPNRRSIWPNFTKFCSKFTRTPRGGYYFAWKVSTDI